MCGRICPQLRQCQSTCVRGIKGEPVCIGDIEAFIFDKAVENGYSLKDATEENKKKVSVKSRLKNIETSKENKNNTNTINIKKKKIR